MKEYCCSTSMIVLLYSSICGTAAVNHTLVLGTGLLRNDPERDHIRKETHQVRATIRRLLLNAINRAEPFRWGKNSDIRTEQGSFLSESVFS